MRVCVCVCVCVYTYVYRGTVMALIKGVSLFQGQWRGDVYHGEGSILHASGVTYKGMWTNGRPAGKTSKTC